MSCIPPENMPPDDEDDEETSVSSTEPPTWRELSPQASLPLPPECTVELYGGALVGIDTTTRTLAITFEPKGDRPPPTVLYKEKEAVRFLAQLRSTLIYLSQMSVSPSVGGDDDVPTV